MEELANEYNFLGDVSFKKEPKMSLCVLDNLWTWDLFLSFSLSTGILRYFSMFS